MEEYVHRIGRTGRGGATGVSHTFFTDNEKGLAGGLVAVLQEANQEVPQEIYKYPMITKKKTSKVSERCFRRSSANLSSFSCMVTSVQSKS